MKNDHPLDHQMSTTHTDEWQITAWCNASWANKTRRTATLPRDKRPRPAAFTDNTENRTTPLASRPRSLVTAIWRDKWVLHTAVPSHDPQARHDAKEIAARLDTTRRRLRV